MKNGEFIEGVNIIAKYLTDDMRNEYNISAEHDQFWFCDGDIVTDEIDVERLNDLGWFIDYGSWCFYT